MFITFKEWYKLEYQQKLLVELSEAYDTLDFNDYMSEQFDKEDFIECIMENRYEFELSELSS